MPVELPSRTDYWVSALSYAPVRAGEPISLLIKGRGFSNETLVLVNNVPLDRRLRLADPSTSEFSGRKAGETKKKESEGDSADSDNAGSGNLSAEVNMAGAFEVVSPSTIAVRFECDKDFPGVPKLTLVSPAKSIHLNHLTLKINGEHGKTLNKIQEEFEKGSSDKHVFFLPNETWSGLRNVKFHGVEASNNRNKVGFSFEVRGVDLSKPESLRLFVGDGVNWSQDLAAPQSEPAATNASIAPELPAAANFFFVPKQRRFFVTGVEVPDTFLLMIKSGGRVELIESIEVQGKTASTNGGGTPPTPGGGTAVPSTATHLARAN